ncbi:hypothetical protein H6P81_008859 [Aristolochia fimbriata]|uniref:DYW domain-containing protein n=1 Tax=Aristolochia fimbriata TaxID=158543 RepID=A0AAV7EJX7_ARIFI|nr:hypothetical protein H6P81_008859 [Aristolochia fimbriata]
MQMLQYSLKPDNFTFPFLVKASSARKSVAEGKQMHGQIVKYGFEIDTFVVNTLLYFYSAAGEMVSAKALFETSPNLDVVSYNTLIDGYVKCGQVDDARDLFDTMPEKNEVSWSSIISGYARNGDLDVAQALFDKMPVKRNVVTWNSMISGFARSGLLPMARNLFDEMPERTLVSWNSMISGYAQNGQLESARELFDQMQEKDVFSWSSIISGYAQNNRCREALNLFKEMLSENKVRPNEVTMLSILSVCAQLAALEQGKWVHAFIDKNKMPHTDSLAAALVDMYMKCGCVETATNLFRKLDQRDVSTWNAFITGLAVNGVSHDSLEAFKEMQRLKINPNDITFMGVLMACSHGGLVREGQKHFTNMSKIYGIQPEMKHYGCMIDMLGRAGLLEEAEEIIGKMPMKPDVMILGALLGACKIHGNVCIARRVGQDFFELKNTEGGCHLLLSNIYAASGRWEEASEIRCRIKRSGFKKEPGSSCVELEGTVHEFVEGDTSHPQTGEIYLWLDEMVKKFRSEGYSPVTANVVLDLGEEDKEMCVTYHSEKLAVAFALISRAAGPSIRIVKNLRICCDCHLFMKYLSSFMRADSSGSVLGKVIFPAENFVDKACTLQATWYLTLWWEVRSSSGVGIHTFSQANNHV